MKKNLTSVPEVVAISSTQYVVLPDGRVARLLTPTIRNGQTFYNLFIDGKYTRTTVAAVLESSKK